MRHGCIRRFFGGLGEDVVGETNKLFKQTNKQNSLFQDLLHSFDPKSEIHHRLRTKFRKDEGGCNPFCQTIIERKSTTLHKLGGQIIVLVFWKLPYRINRTI
jgi:hypothetical protein